ncbi:MAG: hypothetical protein ACKVIX_01575 [Sphingomonadales bacterium]|jgi:hypothetical protein
MLLKNAAGEVYADAITTAYIKKDGNRQRPVTSVFNGGPGSASIWVLWALKEFKSQVRCWGYRHWALYPIRQPPKSPRVNRSGFY